jgi:hypothetical protein
MLVHGAPVLDLVQGRVKNPDRSRPRNHGVPAGSILNRPKSKNFEFEFRKMGEKIFKNPRKYFN